MHVEPLFVRNHLSKLFISSFPPSLMNEISNSVLKGYLKVNELVNNDPTYNWEVGKTFSPHLVRVAVDYHLKEMCEKLGIDYKIEKNSAKNTAWIQLCLPPFIVVANKIETPKSIPRHSNFREELVKPNLLNLIVELENDNNKQYLVLITHKSSGLAPHMNVDSIAIGIPNGTQDQKNGWHVYQELPTVLMNTDSLPAVEKVSKLQVQLKPDIFSQDGQIVI